MSLRSFVQAACVAGLLLLNAGPAAAALGAKTFGERVRQRNVRGQEQDEIARRDIAAALGKNTSSYRYLDKATKPYRVKSLPNVDFDVGEMYSGNIPIDNDDLTRQLFFVFQPSVGKPVDEIVIWLNGGPGCSSLEGFFQENGLFVWQPGTYAPTINPYSWVNLTNVLWVEQPVGTGFSYGKVTATSEEDIAADFIKFFKNFQEIFGISNYKIYVTGESYAGRYVPYISAAMLDQKDTTCYDLSGALVYDPCIGSFEYIQQQMPSIPLVQANANLFNFNASFMSELSTLYTQCGYEAWTEKYLTFPPSGMQPVAPTSLASECDVFDLIFNEALNPNPCFDVYEIPTMCPILFDPLGFPGSLGYLPAGYDQPYFNLTAVKKAMNAPMDINWGECSGPVFVGHGGIYGEGDDSLDPIQAVLPQVIEATHRVLVSNGDYDMIIITNGTLLSIQNMTWNGKMGFQNQPTTPINVDLEDLQYEAVFAENGATGLDAGQGIMGIQHFERGLMWAETYMSGHMQPQYQPRVTYRHLQWLLGRIDAL